ncbi:MAG: A/G-specific adenine glycosylase, partial [Thermoplasmata archaeon]
MAGARASPTGAPRALERTRRRALLAWYDAEEMPWPWRRDRDPYRIWVAEVLLQQTRVAQALPHYERFLARFPD